MRRHSVEVAGVTFVVARGHDMQQAKDDVVSAVRAGGALVNLNVVGASDVSVLVSPATTVIFRSDEIEQDDWDAGRRGDTFYEYSVLDPFDSYL